MITHAIAENGNVVDAANAIMGSMYQCIFCGQKVYKKVSLNGVAYFARKDVVMHDANGCLATEYDRRTAINLNRITCNAFINRLCRPPQPRNPGPGGRGPGGHRPGPGGGSPTGVIRVTALRSLQDLYHIIAPMRDSIRANTEVDGVRIGDMIYLNKFGKENLPCGGSQVVEVQIDDIDTEKGSVKAHTFGYDKNGKYELLYIFCNFPTSANRIFEKEYRQLRSTSVGIDGSINISYAQKVWIGGIWKYKKGRKHNYITTNITSESQIMVISK